ncbi:MAG TPA: pepsin/retropepsin-like aspartic protease family protein [Burkholderiaceae bacterium]
MKATLRTLPLLLAATFALSGAARAECTYLNQMTLPVQYLPGSVLPLVTGSINGKPAAMSLNTGAYSTALLAAQAKRRGMFLRTRYQSSWNNLSQLQADQTSDPNTAMDLTPTTDATVGSGAAVWAYTASVKEFSIGPVKAPAGKLPAVESQPDAPYEAIVGADFLLQSDLELELANNKVRFFRGVGCTESHLAYWDPEAVEVPLQKSDGPQALIEIALNGETVLAMIDTGTVRSFVVPSLAAKLGVTDTGAATAGKSGSEEIEAWLGKFATLKIGAATFEMPYLYVARNEMARPVPYKVVLGLDFLKLHRVLLANSQQKMYFSVKATGKAFPDTRPSVNVEAVGTPRKR